MIFNESKIIADIYLNLLNEDLQSSLNQASTILKNNGIENTEQVVNQLETIYNQAPEEIKIANKDTNIPSLAFWYVADSNIDRIKHDYYQYLSIQSLYSKNYLINTIEELKKDISQKKMFKPSPEKTNLIKSYISKIAQTIHANVKQAETKFDVSKQDDDVVYEDDEIIVYRADSKQKCIHYGAGSPLCISVKGGGNYYWRYRMGGMRDDDLGMTTYFVFWNGTNERILIDALGDENGPANKYSWNPINPNDDDDITPQGLIQKYPELQEPFQQEVFQFVPYSEKEHKFLEIDEKVVEIVETYDYKGNIIPAPYDDEMAEFNQTLARGFQQKLADPLKTAEDVEMAIEAGKELRYYDWPFLRDMFPNDVSNFFKKFIGLENFVPSALVYEYLSPNDADWYENTILRRMGFGIRMSYYMESDINNLPLNIVENLRKDKKFFKDYLNRRRRVGGVPAAVLKVMDSHDFNLYFEGFQQDMLYQNLSLWYENFMERHPIVYNRVMNDPEVASMLMFSMLTAVDGSIKRNIKSLPEELIMSVAKSPQESLNLYKKLSNLDLPPQIIQSILSSEGTREEYVKLKSGNDPIQHSLESFKYLISRLDLIIS